MHALTRLIPTLTVFVFCSATAANGADARAILSPRPALSLGHLTNALACILLNPEGTLDRECIPRLRPADRAPLKEAWKRREGGCARLRLAFALAWVADDQISRLLIDAFRTVGGRSPPVMEFEEGTSMVTLTKAMGICAGRSERMFKYLMRCTDSEFILREKKWHAESPEKERGLAMAMAASCTTAIGASGRPEAAKLFGRIRANGATVRSKNHPLHWGPLNHEAAGGMFWLHLARTRGPEAILHDIASEGDHARYEVEWLATAEGRDWHDWAKKLDEDLLRPKDPISQEEIRRPQ